MNALNALCEQVESAGYAVVAGVLGSDEASRLIMEFESLADVSSARRSGGVRNLLSISSGVRGLAASENVRALIEPILRSGAFPVRGILFDKTPEANWKVPWHQDVTVAVSNRVDTEGFGPWSMKAGVLHVQPPAPILENILSVRIHLDPCAEENGALRVIPGSHRKGKLSEQEAARSGAHGNCAVCAAGVGDALLMRPLLVHASSASNSPQHRRVIHLDFASVDLPPGMGWHEESAEDF